MNENRGTLESLAGELTVLLAPLTGLTPSAAPIILAELGLVLSETQIAAVMPALTKTTSAISKLISADFELDASIDSGGSGLAVASKRIAALSQIADVISGFGQLQTAVAALGLPGAGPIVANLPKRLFDYLLATYLSNSKGTIQLLELAGILVRTDHNVGVFDPATPFYTTNEFQLGRISGWLANPAGQLEELYDWGKPAFDGAKVLNIVERLAGESFAPILYERSATPPSLDVGFARLLPRADLNPRGLALQLHQELSKGAIELGAQGWTATFNLDTGIPADTTLILQPGAISVQWPDAVKLAVLFRTEYSAVFSASDPLVLLSFFGLGRITVEEVAASAVLQLNPDGEASLALSANLKRGNLRVGTDEADGFIAKILSGFALEVPFDLGLGYSIADGLRFSGGGALNVQLAAHFSVGPIAVDALRLSIGSTNGKFPIGIEADLRTSLGPLTAMVLGLGFEVAAALVSDNTGNLGPLDIVPGFKPPTGVGLSIDAGGFRGGGALGFDPNKAEYFGILELTFAEIVSVRAVGILSTRLPDGSGTFSLLIIIATEFVPIQLSYGFTLLGVGGLLGLNRTYDQDTIQAGVGDGTLSSILFPTDVVANAPRLISDLRRVFPAQDGSFLIGPMGKLGYGTPTLASVEIGLFLRFPDPGFIILGIVRVQLPAEDFGTIYIQVNFVGSVDFKKGQLQFDAELVNSRVLIDPITGSLCLRIYWGGEPNLLLSAGGFHPAYTPPPMNLRPMERIGFVVVAGIPMVRAEIYLAITSNSVQFGARVEVIYGISYFNVFGFVSLDVLIQFNPFLLVAEITAMFGVRSGSDVLFAIRVTGTLKGPTPWNVRGEASFEIGFIVKVRISADFEVTSGESRNTLLPTIDVIGEIRKAVDNIGNWRAVLPAGSNQHVTLRDLPEVGDALVLHPFGALEISQKISPLGIPIQRFGSSRPDRETTFSLASVQINKAAITTAPATEEFAPAQFFDMSDADKLSRPSFARYDSGLIIGADNAPQTDFRRGRESQYEVIYLPEHHPVRLFFKLAASLFNAFARGGAAAQSPLSQQKRSPSPIAAEHVSVAAEKYAVVSTLDMTLHAPSLIFASATAADQVAASLIATSPELTGAIQVVPSVQISRAA